MRHVSLWYGGDTPCDSFRSVNFYQRLEEGEDFSVVRNPPLDIGTPPRTGNVNTDLTRIGRQKSGVFDKGQGVLGPENQFLGVLR